MKNTGTKALVAVGVVLVVIITAIVGLFSSYNNARNGMINRENALSAQYQANQIVLSTYISKIEESLGVADRNASQIDSILADAIKGRYDNNNNGKPNTNSVISAIVEAYPDLSGVSKQYEQVQTAVLSGREAYANVQIKLRDMLRDYDTWRNQGIIHSQFVKLAGAPSSNLQAAVNGQPTLTGSAAEDKMKQIVLTGQATDSYTTGKDTGVNTNPNTGKVSSQPSATPKK